MVHPSVGSTLHPTHSPPGAEAIPSPSLHRALESLMVNLDDELLRYRHSRTGQGPSPTAQRKLTFRSKARTSPSLIHLNATGANRRQGQTAPRGASVPTSSIDLPSTNSPPFGAAVTGVSTYPSAATGRSLAPYTAMPDAYLESSTALLGSHPPAADPTAYPADYYPETYYQDEADHQPSLAERLSTPLGAGALLLLLVGSAGFGYLVTSPTAVDHLRNHAWVQRFQPAPAPEADDSTAAAMGEVPTGLQGIGPDLSGQEFGALDLDRVSRLPADPSRPNPTVDPTANPTVDPSADPSSRSAPSATSAQPSLEADPSRDRPQPTEALRPSGTLRTDPVVPLNPSRPTPTTASPNAVTPGPARTPEPSRPAAPSPAATQAPSPLAPPAPQAPPPLAPPAAQPPQPLGTVTTAPTPAPTAPTTATPPPPLAPAARPNYYVVTDYTGNQSLESARGAVGDAYVRDFQGGTKIQMGAFSQESSARDLVQQLQQQGIPAQVYNTP